MGCGRRAAGGADHLGQAVGFAPHLRFVLALHHHPDQGFGPRRPQDDPAAAGEAGLGGRDSDVLRKVADIQRKNGGTVRVVAHAEQDVSGSSVSQIERGNYDVSRRRALAIANQLMALGVPRSAIVAEAASDSEPKFATNTARGIAANRRAEIFLDL